MSVVLLFFFWWLRLVFISNSGALQVTQASLVASYVYVQELYAYIHYYL